MQSTIQPFLNADILLSISCTLMAVLLCTLFCLMSYTPHLQYLLQSAGKSLLLSIPLASCSSPPCCSTYSAFGSICCSLSHFTNLLYSLCSSIACCPASPVTFKHLLHIVQPFLLTVLTHLLSTQPLARCPALSSLWTSSSMLS